MDYRKSYLIYNICLYTGFVLCLISLMTQVNWPGIAGIVVLLAGMLQTVIFYRCPNCHAAFQIRGRRPKHCPECGHPLDGSHQE